MTLSAKHGGSHEPSGLVHLRYENACLREALRRILLLATTGKLTTAGYENALAKIRSEAQAVTADQHQGD